MSKVTVIGVVGNSVFLPVEEFHKGGETVNAKSVHFEYGGKGFNQAVASRRFGVDTTFIGAVGLDGYDGIKQFLTNEKVKPCLVQKNDATAFAAIITDKNGSNHVTVYQGAELKKEDILQFEDEIKNSTILLINNEVSEDVNLTAIRLAKKHQVKVVFNPAPYRKTSREILDNVYLFTPNEHEAKDLDNYTNIIQTLGEKGCLIKETNEIVKAEKVNAVDTTGAGDTFNGVLCACITNGVSLKEAIKWAVKASGKSVTKKGAVSSIPYRDEL